MSFVHSAIQSYKKKFGNNAQIYPIKVVAEPTLHSVESSFHIRTLLSDVHYSVAEQTTDLALQFNYFQKKSSSNFNSYQRVQILYILRHFLSPDQNNGTHPTLRVHILCGDGRLFTAFRQEIALSNLLLQPIPRFSMLTDPGYNALKHGNAFFFEAIGDEVIQLHEVLTLIGARGIQDDQRVATDVALHMPMEEMNSWFRSPSGPCTLSYFIEQKDQLSLAVINSSSYYQRHIARLLKTEWNPYLAGLFIYACRYQLTLSGACRTYGPRIVAGGDKAACQSKEADASNKGSTGDCL